MVYMDVLDPLCFECELLLSCPKYNNINGCKKTNEIYWKFYKTGEKFVQMGHNPKEQGERHGS